MATMLKHLSLKVMIARCLSVSTEGQDSLEQEYRAYSNPLLLKTHTPNCFVNPSSLIPNFFVGDFIHLQNVMKSEFL